MSVEKVRGQITRLMPRHAKALELCLGGMSNKEIAEKLGMTTKMVGMIVNNPLSKHYVEKKTNEQKEIATEEALRREVNAQAVLSGNAIRAANRMVELVDSDNERVALNSAMAVYDRVFSAPGKDGPAITINIEGAIIEKMQAILIESMAVPSLVGKSERPSE
jgi:DNA-binding CsgD family transcriptional regulator